MTVLIAVLLNVVIFLKPIIVSQHIIINTKF